MLLVKKKGGVRENRNHRISQSQNLHSKKTRASDSYRPFAWNVGGRLVL
jgi:hypothetical protein